MTLTEAAYWSKKAVVLFVAFIVIVFIGWQIVNLVSPKPKIPEKYLIPNERCKEGPLPALQIYSINVPVNYMNLEIETATGRYPDLPKIVNVYKIEYRGGSLAAKDMAISIAKAWGFDEATIKRKSANEYLFENATNGKSIIIENSNQHIDLTTSIGSVPTASDVPDNTVLIEAAKRALSTENLFPKTIDTELTRVTYLVKGPTTFNTTASRITAHAGRVDFFKSKELIAVEEQYIDSKELGEFLRAELPNSPKKRVKIDDKDVEVYSYSVPLVPDSPYSSNIYISLGNNKINPPKYDSVYELHYVNWPVAEEACGTYKLMGEDQAVQKIKEGKGYLVHLHLKGTNPLDPLPAGVEISKLKVYEISVAYLDTATLQEYLQPIYVVRGEAETTFGTGEFIIYVPAIEKTNE